MASIVLMVTHVLMSLDSTRRRRRRRRRSCDVHSCIHSLHAGLSWLASLYRQLGSLVYLFLSILDASTIDLARTSRKSDPGYLGDGSSTWARTARPTCRRSRTSSSANSASSARRASSSRPMAWASPRMHPPRRTLPLPLPLPLPPLPLRDSAVISDDTRPCYEGARVVQARVHGQFGDHWWGEWSGPWAAPAWTGLDGCRTCPGVTAAHV